MKKKIIPKEKSLKTGTVRKIRKVVNRKSISEFALNPALKELEIFVGEWNMELSNASFLPNPSATVEGYSSFDWVEGEAYLVMRQGNKPGDSFSASWLISRDEKADDHSIFYFDTRGVSRIYEMSFRDNVWKTWRSSPGFSQRFEGKVTEDGYAITAHWEKSSDGTMWENDFDMKYTRIKS